MNFEKSSCKVHEIIKNRTTRKTLVLSESNNSGHIMKKEYLENLTLTGHTKSKNNKVILSECM